jgi:hypothetical protein
MNFNGVFSAQTFRQDVEIVHFMWSCRDRPLKFQLFDVSGFIHLSSRTFGRGARQISTLHHAWVTLDGLYAIDVT